MKSIAWLYAIFSLIIVALGVFFTAYLPSKMMVDGTTTGPFLLSIVAGLVILAFWIWFVRRIREEGGEEGMPLIELRQKEPETSKVKVKQEVKKRRRR